MRKFLPAVLLLLLLTLLCGAATAEMYVLDSIYASVDIPADFPVVLRDGYLSSFTEWLTAHGKNAEAVASDMQARGVLLQCWNETGDMCFELTAVQTDKTALIFDVNEQSTSVRATYRLSHYPNNEYAADGYDFTSSDWKNTKNGRFLILRYSRREMGEVLYRGFMRRTIRNGYEITLDMRVYNRAVTNKDNVALNKIWDTFTFIEVQAMPPAASAQINITAPPPAETNDPNITMEGTAASGVKLTAVVMGLSYPDPLLFETAVGKNGKFKMPITLPKEGVFLITVTGENEGQDVVELAYPVTYQRTLLTVNVLSEVPASISASSLSINGTSEPGADIQVFVNSEPVAQKRVTAAGKFLVELQLTEEGSYEIALVFSKKELADRRVTYTVNRVWSDGDTLKQLQKEAIKPSYATLVQKMQGYEGRTMGYKAYLLNVTQSGGDWIAEMALTKNGTKYSGIILVVCPEEPNFQIGDRIMMYGTCAGMSLSTAGEGDAADGVANETSYPCFDLLLFSEI